MSLLQETIYGIYGAYRLARLDGGGMAFFSRSVKGFWRSFFAAVLALPAYIMITSMNMSDDKGKELLDAVGPLAISLVEVIAYVTGWVAFPLAMFHITRILERSDDYIGFIIAYNWAGFLQMMVFLPVVAIGLSQSVPEGAAKVLALAVLIAVLYYQWFIAKTALRLNTAQAAGIVALDMFISLFITGFANTILFARMPV